MAFERIIFISEDNTFTSPLAEAMLKDRLNKHNIKNVECSSCGMVALFPEPPNPKGVAIAKSRGLNIEDHVTVPVDPDMFGNQVLALVMSEKIKSSLYDMYRDAVNVYTIKEYVGLHGDIEAPYGKGMKEYGEVYMQLEELVEKVMEKLIKDAKI